MATTPAPAPAESAKVNPAITKAVTALLAAEGVVAVKFDSVRQISKAETTRHGYTEKQLTALLLDAGLNAARASEVKGFVFPAHSAARKELDKALEFNAKQSDPKKRVAKEAILALQRDKTGELTLEKAVAEHKAATTGLKDTRAPGGKTNQTQSASKKAKTAEEIEEELLSMVSAAWEFAKANDYDEKDFAAVCEEASAPEADDEADDEDDDSDGDS